MIKYIYQSLNLNRICSFSLYSVNFDIGPTNLFNKNDSVILCRVIQFTFVLKSDKHHHWQLQWAILHTSNFGARLIIKNKSDIHYWDFPVVLTRAANCHDAAYLFLWQRLGVIQFSVKFLHFYAYNSVCFFFFLQTYKTCFFTIYQEKNEFWIFVAYAFLSQQQHYTFNACNFVQYMEDYILFFDKIQFFYGCTYYLLLNIRLSLMVLF